jgi:hypothetical protein
MAIHHSSSTVHSLKINGQREILGLVVGIVRSFDALQQILDAETSSWHQERQVVGGVGIGNPAGRKLRDVAEWSRCVRPELAYGCIEQKLVRRAVRARVGLYRLTSRKLSFPSKPRTDWHR